MHFLLAITALTAIFYFFPQLYNYLSENLFSKEIKDLTKHEVKDLISSISPTKINNLNVNENGKYTNSYLSSLLNNLSTANQRFFN